MVVDGRNRLDEMHRRGFELFTNGHPNPKYFEPVDLKDDAAVLAYVIGANIRRRHLTPEKQHDVLAELIRLTPEKSDRQLAKETGVSHPTIAKIRKKAGVETPFHVDTKGRKQPAHKPAMAALGRKIEREAKALKEAAQARDLAATEQSEPAGSSPVRYSEAAATSGAPQNEPGVEDELGGNPEDIVHCRTGFLVRAREAINFAYADDPVTEEIVETAEMVARAWTKLAAQLRLKLTGGAS
jgi:hypothetical protein